MRQEDQRELDKSHALKEEVGYNTEVGSPLE